MGKPSHSDVAWTSNSLAVMNAEDVQVVDSHITPRMARELVASIGEITSKPIMTLVNTQPVAGGRRARVRQRPGGGAAAAGARQEHRSLDGSTRTSFRWVSLLPGTYAIRACSLNEDSACGPWSALSNEVVID